MSTTLTEPTVDAVATASALVARARRTVPAMSPAQVQAHNLAPGTLLVDVREPEEIDDEGLIAGAWHVPRGLLEFWADPADAAHREIFDPARLTIVYCSDGQRSALAAEVLVQLGYANVGHLDGGLRGWKDEGYAVAGLHPWHRDA